MAEKTGPCEVWLSSWAITEDPVRMLFTMKEHGQITALHCLLDHRIKERKPAPLQLLQGFAKVGLAQCHAKIAVAVGEALSIACVGSANLSRNPRLEAGIITASHNACQFHKHLLKEQIYG